ncbi:MAG: hypothetical protein A2445_03025 [Candidatus Jacksonbacteria bacterium RIFOXYC2_FULL_44_29]|nr:MAG: Glycosyl transferase group 1 [Parcubacteria group bacterium GW2011_GWC2_44_22]OGY75922.1 MAG: hypothetical protein A2240_05100 [Candidatus Jacksonbacteria bacterium RIFOXYA2_FULL_43_12]OGY75984.1 MAG: hypothetical protein A2295_00020 [Candidatus Jacksonbacteria bacterium RIFOXYB2_FULL_44_15]OGY79064.1 MAG: hypothetical protein A2445_03025 [Candidatus Jacksonbacteria bacterium RIFOXYC2_FULL_44_29]OGY81110.1 MAG: hypothetical protein A2550_01215 [Candidatus Jacksonbacteria bacterium RIFOX
MRIGYFTDTYLPATHGVAVSIESFRHKLEAKGHEIYIYAPQSPGYVDKNSRVTRFKSLKIIENPELRYAFNLLPVKQSFLKLTNFKLDLVHAQTPFSLGVLAKIFAERQLIPLIYTHHTHYPEYAKAYFREKILLPHLAKVYSTWFANLCDGVIAPSLAIKKMLKGYGVKDKVPIYVLPTGICVEHFTKKVSAEAQLQLRHKLGIKPDAKVLISVGRIGKEKNFDFLLNAYREMRRLQPGLVLLLIGDGSYLPKLKENAKNLGISDSVIFTGLVPHDDIPKYYQMADLFLFASLTDTQGIVVLEAMAAGLPVVALKCDVFLDIIKSNHNGFLVNTASPRVFADKVLALLKTPKEYHQFVSAAVDTAKHFSEESVANRLISIYEEQLASFRAVGARK